MPLARICRIAIFATVIAVLIFDLWLAAFGGPSSTISLQGFEITGGDLMSFQYRSLLLCIGYLVGHILGRIDK